jgi:hypothetical protein
MIDSKPICVIYFPWPNSFNPTELMAIFNGWDEGKGKRQEGFEGYLWFCFIKYGIEAPEFQVFHPKDFTDIQFEELKQLVLNNLPTQ